MADAWKYLQERKALSLVFVLWACWLVSYVVIQVFTDISKINAAVVSALGTVFGLPALAVGVIKWRQNKNAGSD